MQNTIPMVVFRTIYQPSPKTHPSCDGATTPFSRWLLIVSDDTGVVFLDQECGRVLAGPFPTLLESNTWAEHHITPYDMPPYRRACAHHHRASQREQSDDLDRMIAKNRFPTQNVALAAADRMTVRSDGLYEAQRGSSGWGIVRQPRLGEPVSFKINGCTHYAGLISKANRRTAIARLRWPSGAPSLRVFTKRTDGSWNLRGSYCRMLHGVFNSSPRS